MGVFRHGLHGHVVPMEITYKILFASIRSNNAKKNPSFIGYLQAQVQQPVLAQAVKWLHSPRGESDSQRHLCGWNRHEGKRMH